MSCVVDSWATHTLVLILSSLPSSLSTPPSLSGESETSLRAAHRTPIFPGLRALGWRERKLWSNWTLDPSSLSSSQSDFDTRVVKVSSAWLLGLSRLWNERTCRFRKEVGPTPYNREILKSFHVLLLLHLIRYALITRLLWWMGKWV